MLGTIVNTGTLIVGTAFGAMVRTGIGERYKTSMFNALGLCCLLLGSNATLSNIGKSDFPVLFILSLTLGGVIGTRLRLAERVERLSGNKKESVNGLSTGLLLYCIGLLPRVLRVSFQSL